MGVHRPSPYSMQPGQIPGGLEPPRAGVETARCVPARRTWPRVHAGSTSVRRTRSMRPVSSRTPERWNGGDASRRVVLRELKRTPDAPRRRQEPTRTAQGYVCPGTGGRAGRRGPLLSHHRPPTRRSRQPLLRAPGQAPRPRATTSAAAITSRSTCRRKTRSRDYNVHSLRDRNKTTLLHQLPCIRPPCRSRKHVR